jgi:transcriptional regulator with XRE-family HTH domain
MPRPKPTNGIDPRWKVIGARIAADRKAKGLGQAELGRMIGLQTSTSMWRYEDGQVVIPVARLEQIAEALGRPASRYIPATNKPIRPTLSAAELRAMHLRLAHAAMEAAAQGSPQAIEAFNELLAEFHERTGR